MRIRTAVRREGSEATAQNETVWYTTLKFYEFGFICFRPQLRKVGIADFYFLPIFFTPKYRPI